MLDPNFIDDVVKRLSAAVPSGLQTLRTDLERNFRAVLQATFAKFDLVTREEFDAQAGVLAKTRAKLEALERQVAELEKH
jgi:ubiquinone biosynthesis accessory factor UbiK